MITGTPLISLDFGTRIYRWNDLINDRETLSYLPSFRCALAADKAKLEMSRSKFLDCGEMVNLTGMAKAILEDNHPCARMVPLVIFDEETELPEMKGPNTYRQESRWE